MSTSWQIDTLSLKGAMILWKNNNMIVIGYYWPVHRRWKNLCWEWFQKLFEFFLISITKLIYCNKKKGINYKISEFNLYLTGGGGGCFPSSARLQLENGKSVTMSELQVGDQVQTGTENVHQKWQIWELPNRKEPNYLLKTVLKW